MKFYFTDTGKQAAAITIFNFDCISVRIVYIGKFVNEY